MEEFSRTYDKDLKYLTFAGPEGFDIEFFVDRGIFKLDNVRVWEKSADVMSALQAKYGLDFKVKLGEAFDLAKSRDERSFFPHSIINLDFTNGAFNLNRPRHTPHKFELVSNIIATQREHMESFLLLLAFAATADVDTEYGKGFVQKTAFDLATRFGYTGPLFNLTREPNKTYSQTLAAVIPCSVIRQGAEYFYDTQCLGKALYFPFGRKRTAMLCFIFQLTYDNPPLSETNLQILKRMDEVVIRRQEQSFKMPLVNVNNIMRATSRRRRGS